MKVLVMGANGMIGSAMLTVLSNYNELQVSGTVRDNASSEFFTTEIRKNLHYCEDLVSLDVLTKIIKEIHPHVVVNCAGVTKHKEISSTPSRVIAINSLMPHLLADVCDLVGARLIHVSTDCVFSGRKGGYLETDPPDACDLYGKSKALGEVVYPNCLTLRTSTIGHEFDTQYGLLEWFLSQNDFCKGYSKAIFSGLPSVIFADIVCNIILLHPKISGLIHVAAAPINKHKLLSLIADVYEKKINIEVDNKLVIDRSLNGELLFNKIGYRAPEWSVLVRTMRSSSTNLE